MVALEGGYGTRLVEDDARHSRQHLDRRLTEADSESAAARVTSGFRLQSCR